MVMNLEVSALLLAIGLNIALAMVLAPLINGIERKVRARLQNRRGPPITQTIHDLVKLYRKHGYAIGKVHRVLPFIALIHVVLALALLPTISRASLSMYGDLIVFIYLISASTLYLAIGSIASGNPFSGIGASREISMLMLIEFTLAFIVAGIAIAEKSIVIDRALPLSIYLPYPPFVRPSLLLIAIVLAIIVYVESLRLPFELAEAEPEIASGILVEYGGPYLATAIYTLLLKRYAMLALLIDALLPRETIARFIPIEIPFLSIGIDSLLFLVLIIVLAVVYASIEAFFGRYRIDMALKFLKRLCIVGLAVVILAALGL